MNPVREDPIGCFGGRDLNITVGVMSFSPVLTVRKQWYCIEQIEPPEGQDDGKGPLRKVAACAVVSNPFAGRGFVEDLSHVLDASAELGATLGSECLRLLGGSVESYGKAGMVGSGGEQEHVNACLTSSFGNAFRESIGGADAWISSTTKLGGPGTSIDVPLAYKDEIWVRSHYDTVTLAIPDAPLAGEMVVIAAVANRGRLNARLGGLSREEADRNRAQL